MSSIVEVLLFENQCFTILEYLEISSPIYLCKWALSNKLDYKDFFKRNNKTIIVKTDLEVSFNFSHEAVFCVDDINR